MNEQHTLDPYIEVINNNQDLLDEFNDIIMYCELRKTNPFVYSITELGGKYTTMNHLNLLLTHHRYITNGLGDKDMNYIRGKINELPISSDE